MSEKEAWWVCVMLWERPRRASGEYVVLDGCLGLCPTIRNMRKNLLISATTEEKMRTKIKQLPAYEGGSSFKFGTDRRGAQDRVNFCMEQYRKLGGK